MYESYGNKNGVDVFTMGTDTPSRTLSQEICHDIYFLKLEIIALTTNEKSHPGMFIPRVLQVYLSVEKVLP